MSTVITSQPRPQDSPIEENDTNTSIINQEDNEEENHRKENESRDIETCCWVMDTEDTWWICQCIAWFCHCMATCTDDSSEGCAECIASCCEETAATTDEADDCSCCMDCTD